MKRITTFGFVVALVFHSAILLAAEPIVVKFELLGTGHIVVPVRINGKGPFRIGLDTGSPVTFVNTRTAAEVGIGGGAGNIMGIGMGMGARCSVDIGGAKADNVHVMVLNHPTVAALGSSQGGMEGLIGYSFLSRFRHSIDYRNKEVVFIKPVDYQPRDIMQIMRTMLGSSPAVRLPERAVVLGAAIEDLGNQTREARVTLVVPGGAAEAAGLQRGDVITVVNGRWVFEPQDLYDGVASMGPGLPARLKVMRNGIEKELTVNPRPGL